LIKGERIKKKIYGTREEARHDIFDYIGMFYNGMAQALTWHRRNMSITLFNGPEVSGLCRAIQNTLAYTHIKKERCGLKHVLLAHFMVFSALQSIIFKLTWCPLNEKQANQA
jgi:hypothetical protein